MLGFWEMKSTRLLPSLPGPLWLGMVPSEIELLEIELFDHLTVFKQMTYV